MSSKEVIQLEKKEEYTDADVNQWLMSIKKLMQNKKGILAMGLVIDTSKLEQIGHVDSTWILLSKKGVNAANVMDILSGNMSPMILETYLVLVSALRGVMQRTNELDTGVLITFERVSELASEILIKMIENKGKTEPVKKVDNFEDFLKQAETHVDNKELAQKKEEERKNVESYIA